MLAVPSLKPNRLRGVGPARLGGRGLAEAELGPPHRGPAGGDPGQVADRVHRDLRVVGAGLHREVAAAAAPGRACRRERGRSASAAGRLAARPNRSSNRAGPKPMVRVRLAASRPTASPVSDGGASRLVRAAAADPAVGGHLPGRRGPVLEQRDQRGPVGGRDVEGREVQVALHRGGDAGLVRAVEVDPTPVRAAVVGCRASTASAAARRRQHPARRHPRSGAGG